jgi:hypothetical protein
MAVGRPIVCDVAGCRRSDGSTGNAGTIMSGQNSTLAGWYPDPSDSQRVRYWNGSNWSGDARPAAPSAGLTVSLDSSASTRARRPWWQTWLAIVPGLLLCLPLGLVGLWLRRGTSTLAKTVVTAGNRSSSGSSFSYIGCDDIGSSRSSLCQNPGVGGLACNTQRKRRD